MKFKADFDNSIVKRHADLYIDNRKVTIDRFSEITEIGKKTIMCAMDRAKDSDAFHIIIDNMLFKKEHNLPHQTRIYRRDNKKYCAKFLRELTGVKEMKAWQLLDDWESGKKTLEEIQNTFPDEENAEKFNTSHANYDLDDIGKRRSIDDVKVGSWELAQLKKNKED